MKVFFGLLVALFGIVSGALHAQTADSVAETRAAEMARKIIVTLYPEIELPYIKLNIKVDSVVSEKTYRFGVLVESSQELAPKSIGDDRVPTIKSSRQPVLRLMVGVQDGIPTDIFADGEYLSGQLLENTKTEVALHREWKKPDIVRALKSRGAHFAPPNVPLTASITKRLNTFFPGLSFGRPNFVLRITEDPPQPWLLWEFRSIEGKNRDDVLLTFEPFNGRVRSLHVINRPPA